MFYGQQESWRLLTSGSLTLQYSQLLKIRISNEMLPVYFFIWIKKKSKKTQHLYVMIVALYRMLQLKSWVFSTATVLVTTWRKELVLVAILETDMFLVMLAGLVKKSLTLPPPHLLNCVLNDSREKLGLSDGPGEVCLCEKRNLISHHFQML